jgi:hypothetical protein
MPESFMSEHRVIQSLRALADHDRAEAPSSTVEVRLRSAFRARKRRRRAAWITAGAVAAGAAAALFLLPGPPPVLEIAVAPPAAPSIAVPAAGLASIPRPVRRVRPQNTPQEVVTQFFPLMDPAPPFERGQILRVNVPASAMRTVGLPVQEEHLADSVQADVLVGEEGMPRAIRFVSFQVQ